MASLGLVPVEDGTLESRRKMMAFRTIRNKFHIPCGYGYIWQSILALPRLVFRKIGHFVSGNRFLWCTLMMCTISWLKIKLG